MYRNAIPLHVNWETAGRSIAGLALVSAGGNYLD